MKNNEEKNLPSLGLMIAIVGALTLQTGLPLSIIWSISGNETLGWRIASLLISSLFILAIFFSFFIKGTHIIVEHSYADRQSLYINFASTLGCCCICTFISYRIVYSFHLEDEILYTYTLFWIITFTGLLFALYYSHLKFKGRITQVLETNIKIDEYLNDVLIKIKNAELSYGAAFRKVEKEIPDKFYRVKCTNKLIFAYEKLSYKEKKNDFEAYLKDRNLLLETYPLKSYYK